MPSLRRRGSGAPAPRPDRQSPPLCRPPPQPHTSSRPWRAIRRWCCTDVALRLRRVLRRVTTSAGGRVGGEAPRPPRPATAADGGGGDDAAAAADADRRWPGVGTARPVVDAATTATGLPLPPPAAATAAAIAVAAEGAWATATDGPTARGSLLRRWGATGDRGGSQPRPAGG